MNKYPGTNFHDLNLDWVINQVKSLTTEWLSTKAAWTATQAEWQQLYNFVTNYFANLNVTNEINAKLDQMAQDGTLLAVIQDTVEAQAISATSSWLADHIVQETGYVLDNTLKTTNAAADAKAAGEAVAGASLSGAPYRVGNLLYPAEFRNGHGISASNGTEITLSTSWNSTLFIAVKPGKPYYWGAISATLVAFYDAAHNFVSLASDTNVFTSNSLNNPFTLPDGIAYARFTVPTSDAARAFVSAGDNDHERRTAFDIQSDAKRGAWAVTQANAARAYVGGQTTIYAPNYIQGGLDNGAHTIYNFSNRIQSAGMERYPFDVIITPDSGYLITSAIYNEDGSIASYIGAYNATPRVFPRGTLFKIAIQAAAAAGVADIAPHVHVEIFETLPYYYYANNYIAGKAETIRNLAPVDGLQFVFLTDYHVPDNAGASPQLVQYLRQHTNSAPFIVFGGDVLTATVVAGRGPMEDAVKWQEILDSFGKSTVYQVQGNHDYVGYYYVDETRTLYAEKAGVCRQLVMGNLETAKISGVPGKGYYYFDIPTANTRVIVLNDYDTTRNEPDFYGYTGMSTDQITWVANEALADDTKRLIFVSHTPYDAAITSESVTAFAKMQQLFAAIVNKTTWSFGSLSKNFTNTGMEFVAHFCGHAHEDRSNIDDNGVLTVMTTCDKLTGTRTAGTIEEQAFDVVTVDYSSDKLYLTRIGSGADRSFNL